jgi:hypothetical protein
MIFFLYFFIIIACYTCLVFTVIYSNIFLFYIKYKKSFLGYIFFYINPLKVITHIILLLYTFVGKLKNCLYLNHIHILI